MRIGRNQPCPCGSGRKYKRCCRTRHEIGREATEAVDRAARASGAPLDHIEAHLRAVGRASTVARDHLAAGDFEAAIAAAQRVYDEFPGEIDGLELLAQIHEKRGAIDEAIRCHRLILAHVMAMPDYGPDAVDETLEALRRLGAE